MKNIFRDFLYFLIIMFICVFLIGIYEITRDVYLFQIVEDNLLNSEITPEYEYNQYLEFKTSFIFTNEPFLILLNFLGFFGLLYILIDSWREGKKDPPLSINRVFNIFTLGVIFMFYLLVIIMNYLINLLINDILLLLFETIYEQIYVFNLFVDYYIPLFLLAFFLYWLSNQIKYYNLLNFN